MNWQAPARSPCDSCPYRRDVASGVWSADEYGKLPSYDAPTPEQPTAAFGCHQHDGRLCAGWCGCHDLDHSLALRLAAALGLVDEEVWRAAVDYVSPVPLWSTGAEAARHGLADLADPGGRARATIDRLTRKLPPA